MPPTDEPNALRFLELEDGSFSVELPHDPLWGPSGPSVSISAGVLMSRKALEARRALPTPRGSTISLGEPQVVELKRVPVGDTSGLDNFLGATEARFFLVHLACSFSAIAKERFLRATLDLRCYPSSDAESWPVAWSMDPRCLPQVTELSRTGTIGADLKIAGFSLGGQSQSTKTACVIRAYNELSGIPRWEFHRRRHAELEGTQRLIMVISTPTPALARVAFDAELQQPGRIPLRGHLSNMKQYTGFKLTLGTGIE